MQDDSPGTCVPGDEGRCCCLRQTHECDFLRGGEGVSLLQSELALSHLLCPW